MGGGYLTNFLYSDNFPNFNNHQNTGYQLNNSSYSAAVTAVKCECDLTTAVKIWMRFKGNNVCFCKIRNIPNGENNNYNFSYPTAAILKFRWENLMFMTLKNGTFSLHDISASGLSSNSFMLKSFWSEVSNERFWVGITIDFMKGPTVTNFNGNFEVLMAKPPFPPKSVLFKGKCLFQVCQCI